MSEPEPTVYPWMREACRDIMSELTIATPTTHKQKHWTTQREWIRGELATIIARNFAPHDIERQLLEIAAGGVFKECRVAVDVSDSAAIRWRVSDSRQPYYAATLSEVLAAFGEGKNRVE